MPHKPLETSYDVDPDRYQLTEKLRIKIISAFKGVLQPAQITSADFETVVDLLNETHGYWFHYKHYAPLPSEVIKKLEEIEDLAEALLQLLDISLSPPSPPKSASRARRGSGARASRPSNMTDQADEERRERKVRTHEYALTIIHNVLSPSTVTETDGEHIAPSLFDLRDILSKLLKLRGKMVEDIKTAPRTRHYLEPMISGVAERIFKPHGLSQSYITRGKKRVSEVAGVAQRLSKLLNIDDTPPSLATITEIHKKLYPGWRPPAAND
jgi:hypothetical protein